MEQKVVVKETKKTPTACDACKRRKGKCTGTTPCAYCKDNKITCSYIQANRTRGPNKKQKVESNGQLVKVRSVNSPSVYENTLTNEYERSNMIDMYLEHMAQGIQSRDKQKLLHPQTIPQQMRTCAVMAFVARGIGHLARAEQLASDARVLAGQMLESRTFDAAEAFIALSGYFPLHDHRNLMYMGLAHSITKMLSDKTEDGQRLYNFSLVGSTSHDTSMDFSTKRRIMKVQGPSLLAAIKDPTPLDILLASMIKFYCNLTPRLVDALDITKIRNLHDVRLTKEEAEVIMSDVVIMDYLVAQHATSKILKFLIKVAKILVLWLSGNVERALVEADNSIEWDCFDSVKYLTAATLLIEIPQAFYAIVLFYTRVGKLEKAEKVYEMFTTLAKMYGQGDLLTTHPSPATMMAAAAQFMGSSQAPSSAMDTANLPPSHSGIINIPFISYDSSPFTADTTTTTTTTTTPSSPPQLSIPSPSIFLTPPSPMSTSPIPSSPPSFFMPPSPVRAMSTTPPPTTTTTTTATISIKTPPLTPSGHPLSPQPTYYTNDQNDDEPMSEVTFAHFLNGSYDEDVNKILTIPTPPQQLPIMNKDDDYVFLEKLLMR